MYNRLFKEITERIVALFLLILLLPVMAIIFMVLLIELRSFPFFIQERALTLNSQRFKMIKFRTMRINSQTAFEIGDKSAFLKPELNSYVPRFAGWLRKKGLDELPQLINVIIGNMSIVGPRPFMISDIELLKEENEYLYSLRSKLKCKPGITGLWQIGGNREKGLKNLVELDEFYNQHQSFLLDLLITSITIVFLFFAFYPDSIAGGQSTQTFKYQTSSFIRAKLLERIQYIYR